MSTSTVRRNFLKAAGFLPLAGLFPLGLSASGKQRLALERLLPNKLNANSTLGIVAPASIIKSDALEKAEEAFTEQGYSLKIGKYVANKYGYFAGTDQERAEDLVAMFADQEVDAILIAQGGWGCSRILPYLDFEIIKANPKPLIGFSDVTALLLAIYAKTGMVTYHGPNALSEWNDFTTTQFDRILLKGESMTYQGYLPSEGTATDKRFTIMPGTANGFLIGGNLTVMTTLMGSEYLPNFEGAILFLEDIDEAVYKVDRMLTHLKLVGVLKQVNGIVFTSCNACSANDDTYDYSLRKMLIDQLKPLGKPAFFGMNIGHVREKYTLPLGISAQLNASAGTLQLLERPVNL